MKKSLAFLLIFICLLLVSCSKVDKTLQENVTPAAKSDYSSATVLADANNWTKADPTKRRIGAIANTGSMLQTMDSRTIALVEKLGPNDSIDVGEILGYSNPSITSDEIAHRLIRINSDSTLVFKGDSNDNEDPPVGRAAVKWRVVGLLYTNGK